MQFAHIFGRHTFPAVSAVSLRRFPIHVRCRLARDKEKEQQQLVFEDPLEEEYPRSVAPSPPRKEKNTTIDSLFKTQDDPPTIADREVIQLMQQMPPPQPMAPVTKKNTVNLGI